MALVRRDILACSYGRSDSQSLQLSPESLWFDTTEANYVVCHLNSTPE